MRPITAAPGRRACWPDIPVAGERDREPERYEAAAVRWIGRYCVEQPAVSLEDIDRARAAFSLMRSHPEQALIVLQALCIRR